MLNAGLCTLTYLKSRLLPEASQDDTTWDAALSKLGLAITGRMEQYCNRKFDWVENTGDYFSAWNLSISLTRYPVVDVSDVQIVEMDDESTALENGTWLLDGPSGLIEFPAVPGTRLQRVRVVYSGGYWLEDAEDRPGTGPAAGAVLLPDDLLETFVSEVQRHAEERGIFEAVGLRSSKAKDEKNRLASGLSEACKDALNPYRRIAGA